MRRGIHVELELDLDFRIVRRKTHAAAHERVALCCWHRPIAMFGDDVIKVRAHVALEFRLKGHHVRPAIEPKNNGASDLGTSRAGN